MPEIDGLEATMEIRKFNKSIYIIAQSAYVFEDDFINSKKVDFEKLAQVLKATSLLPQKPVILVVADENVPLRHVTQVVDLCRKNSLEDFRLQAR